MKIVEAEIILERLFQYYKVASNLELADKMEITRQTLTNWKQRNSISAIKKKCRELEIYNDIFGNVMEEHKDHLELDIQNEKTLNKIDAVTYVIFKEAYDKAIKNNDLKNFRIRIMGDI